MKPLPLSSALEQYRKQAEELLASLKAGDSEAIGIFHRNHPRFLDSKITWLPRDLADSEIQNAALDLADAQLTLARWYGFRDWPALADLVEAVHRPESPASRFEYAVEAVIDGDLATLERLLREDPQLVRARSTRITPHDPPAHRATLLHYVAANGVEGYRQRTPANAVAVAKMLLEAGAEVDALAGMYGGQCTTMSMLVSSSHPATAGVQAALAETLLDFGASIDGALLTALAFGYQDTAQALVRRGAKVDNVATAAGLGQLAEATRLLPTADALSRHRALALAAQHGHAEVVRLLLDAGEDPNRLNPPGNHGHSTPLHQAALVGHEAVVRLLVERGARLDIEDTLYHGTPLGWAIHGGQRQVESYLRGRAGS